MTEKCNFFDSRQSLSALNYSTAFSPKSVLPISQSVLIGEIFIMLIFLSYVKNCIEDTAIFTTLMFYVNFSAVQIKGSWTLQNVYSAKFSYYMIQIQYCVAIQLCSAIHKYSYSTY